MMIRSGLLCARKLNGLQTVAAFDGLKTEGVQQVAEELHVELVIFDHEDFLGGRASPSAHHVRTGPGLIPVFVLCC